MYKQFRYCLLRVAILNAGSWFGCGMMLHGYKYGLLLTLFASTAILIETLVISWDYKNYKNGGFE